MTTVRLTPRMVGEYNKKLGKAFEATLRKGMASAGMRAVAHLQALTRGAGAVNTGNYLRAWKSVSHMDGVSVFNLAPYAGVIEYGRRPGGVMPPIDAIAQWVLRKLRRSAPIQRGARAGQTWEIKYTAQAARGLAFVIARSIAKKGTPGRHIVDRGTGEFIRFLMEETEREVKRFTP